MKKHKALSSVIDGKVLKMFIVNAQAIIQKNYSLATFEKSVLTGTSVEVLGVTIEGKGKRAGCPSVEKIYILFLVCAIPSCQGGHPVCVCVCVC